MKAIIKRQIKSYLKNPLFWVGILVVFIGVYQLLAPYLTIHYVEKDEKLPTEHLKNRGNFGKILFSIRL